MIGTFGPIANRYASGLGDLDAVVTDLGLISEAFGEALRRRDAGRPFYGMVLIDEPRVAFGYNVGEQLLERIDDYDRRRIMIDALARGTIPINGVPAEAQWSLPSAFETIAVEFFGLCHTVLVRSFAEARRIDAMFARSSQRIAPPLMRILATANVPAVVRVRPQRAGAVVWAPHRPALDTALHLHGLAEFYGDVTCVSAGGPHPVRARATFLSPGDPAIEQALTTAAVVCVDPSDPSEAVAFARLGYGVVAPVTSGAHEFAPEVIPWDPLNARFLHTAVAIAVTRPAAVRVEPPRPSRVPGSG
jgi:hypothetical protein